MPPYFVTIGHTEGLNRPAENPCALLDFARLMLPAGASHSGATGDREVALVLLGGRCTVQVGDYQFSQVGKRPNPFAGKPHTVYLPAGQSYTITAETALDAALCSAPADLVTDPYVIEPGEVVANVVGAANFARELRTILTASDQPTRAAQRLIVGETFVPSGNWSTYPPHKHEVDDLPREARHEEMYYFRVAPGEGFGICRHYSPERGYDFNYTVKDSTLFMAPHGYHTTCSAPGYTNYFLWFLAGDHRTQAVAFDPDLAWVQKTVPMLTRG